MGNVQQEFLDSLKQGFVDSATPSDGRFSPRLLSNNAAERTNVLSTLKDQLSKCERFDFSVAFITKSGIETIIQLLLALREAKIPGRILTTTYNNFNDPEALRKLMEFPNLEVRVFEGNLHTKGYFFKRDQMHAMIIGSANLTQTALCTNREWNLLLHSFEEGEIFQATRREFETLWRAPETVALSQEWIEAYAEYREEGKPASPVARRKSFVSEGIRYETEEIATPAGEGITSRRKYALIEGNFGSARQKPEPKTPRITPNNMQKKALASLEKIHAENAERALLISATGTGKTYLSAFDVAVTKPKKVLFIAHRKRILEASKESFERVLGDSYTYDIIQADNWHSNASCVFAMVSTLVKHLDELDPLTFDYVIVDESHRAGAESYRKVMSHFAPKFMLGMTATPQRSDDYDIFKLFNHVIAYRITLQDALGEDMLTPFHYYGIADFKIDDTEKDAELFNRLTAEDRVDHILQKIEDYSISRDGRRGLIFCSRNEEAQALSEEFNKRGYRTRALSGSNTDAQRNQAIADLESGELEYLLSVDIFNEGIDIPSVNQVIMLRPTESVIVFVQQLGRGLRKFAGKESVLVLDFIGNYQNNYLIPVALSGDCSYNKDNLRRFVKEGSTAIPGCSTVSFDRISEGRIFEKLDATAFARVKHVLPIYKDLKNMLGRIPALTDFDKNGSLDPLLIFKLSNIRSYHDFLAKYEDDYSASFTKTQEQMLAYVSQKLADGKRCEDLLTLKALIENGESNFAKTPENAKSPNPNERAANSNEQDLASVERIRLSVAACLTNQFVATQQQKTYSECIFLEEHEGGFLISDGFKRALNDPDFKKQMLDLVEFGLARHERDYAQPYRNTSLVLNQKYTYEDAFRMLGWAKDANKQNVGGYMYDAETNTFPVFINYKKDDDISDTTKYEDEFLSECELIAISKSNRTMGSNEIVRLQNHPNNGMRVFLFVRKNKDDKDGGKEFYFLGEMTPTQEYEQFTMKGTTTSAVRIRYRLKDPVRADIYDYLTKKL